MTHLLITRRRIPLDRFEEYSVLWSAVRAAATASDARAWVFEAEHSGDRFIEFIEWRQNDEVSVLDDTDVIAALADLNDAFHTEDSETWLETKI